MTNPCFTRDNPCFKTRVRDLKIIHFLKPIWQEFERYFGLGFGLNYRTNSAYLQGVQILPLRALRGVTQKEGLSLDSMWVSKQFEDLWSLNQICHGFLSYEQNWLLYIYISMAAKAIMYCFERNPLNMDLRCFFWSRFWRLTSKLVRRGVEYWVVRGRHGLRDEQLRWPVRCRSSNP